MATGIRDKVAIIGMGCTHFGERWDVGAEGLMVEAFSEALPTPASAGTRSRPPGWGPAWRRSASARAHCPCRWPSACPKSPSPGWRISAPPGPRPFGAPATQSLPAPMTSPWRWASKSSRTPATAGCPTGAPRPGRSPGNGCPTSPRRAPLPNWPAPMPPATAFRRPTSSAPWRTSPPRAMPMPSSIPKPICAKRSPRTR
jgi:hypothetical protein